ncbi:hypothetical protein SUGI_0770780 [Cryptomeria japonica]|uniref:uncharacterized protein LOC131068819 n=1 Tax=Cryptomeria japonica TaxID=3369 RepID=UPI0024148BDF|nr:uncharacterized protein LOC131068819 [Cryptomeria japonica]GLJ37883.1 hypothetical protein SUGI_0770780 [Cryptomeria japonica]
MDVKAAARSKRAQTQKAKSKHSTKHTHHSKEQKKNEAQLTQDHRKNEAQHSQEHKKKETQQGQSSHLQKVSQPKIAKPSPKEAQQGQSSHFQEDPQLQNAKPSQDLPTNWDRYEGPDQGGDVPPQQESVPIKSKGADYAYLISQAQEQSGFDAVMPAYAEGITSMLYVRGQNLLSWGKDDNFIVKDDNASTEYEASFLSLDLHWLASQLAQLECSKRLFIEEDKLPAEMCSSDSRAESHQLREQQQVHTLQNESRASAQSGKHELGEVEDEVFSNENKSAVCNVQSMEEYERKDLKDTTGKSILSLEQVSLPKVLGQGTVHSNKEAENLYLSSLDSPIKGGSSLYKADLQKNVEKSNGIEDRKFHTSDVKNSKETNLVVGNDIRAGPVRFEAAAAEAELDALLDALDKPSNVGMLEVRGTISDRIFTEKSLYKDKQPFQDQLQGPTNIISRNSHSLTLDNTHSKNVNRGHQVDTAKNTSGSKSRVATLLTPKLSTFKDAPKVVEDDFDAWLDTI